MAGFSASLELSLSPEQMEFHGKFLSKWNFAGILFGGLLARIAKYLINGSLREVKFDRQWQLWWQHWQDGEEDNDDGHWGSAEVTRRRRRRGGDLPCRGRAGHSQAEHWLSSNIFLFHQSTYSASSSRFMAVANVIRFLAIISWLGGKIVSFEDKIISTLSEHVLKRGWNRGKIQLWADIWSRKILTTDWKLSSPEEAQKEADSSQKDANDIWPKFQYLGDMRWTDSSLAV
jgi:hypothetical protein